MWFSRHDAAGVLFPSPIDTRINDRAVSCEPRWPARNDPFPYSGRVCGVNALSRRSRLWHAFVSGLGVRLATGRRWRMMTGRFLIHFQPAVRSENVREPVISRQNTVQAPDRRQVVNRRRKTNTTPGAESAPVTRVSVLTVLFRRDNALTETRLRQTL